MESLVSLGESLPASNLANAEKDLLASFKAAALSITTLYRSSRHTSKRAFNAGYTSACQDLLLMIQHGVSSAGPAAGGTMDVGRVMDWIDARLSAIRSREEEEDEEDERERAGPKHHTPVPGPSTRKRPSPPPSSSAPISSPTVPPAAPPAAAPAPSPTASGAPARAVAPLPPTKPARARASPPLAFPASTAYADPPPLALSDMSVGLGQKRRHALVALSELPAPASPASALSSPAPAAGGASGMGVRRRTRSAVRGGLTLAPHRANVLDGAATATDMMDVEDEGRERKRVARR